MTALQATNAMLAAQRDDAKHAAVDKQASYDALLDQVCFESPLPWVAHWAPVYFCVLRFAPLSILLCPA